MSIRGSSKSRTLCEVLREINDIHQSQTDKDKKTRKLLAEAEQMGKRMSAKLKDYNKEVFKDWWQKNKDYEKDFEKRMKENYCTG